MNCEKHQNWLSDFIDGSLTPEDCKGLELHLTTCAGCAEAHHDLDAILEFCREHRGEYDAVPNERALWVRISNTIESELTVSAPVATPDNAGWWSRLMNRRWQLSFPQLAASGVAIIVVVSLVSFIGLGRFAGGGSGPPPQSALSDSSLEVRYRQRQQVIDYWNQRVELNKARWSTQMRETFDQNMMVIDTAVNDSLRHLRQNPHDEISEEILNAALTDKVELLKEFAAL